ncbi:hypothetical protein BT96DRAFT_937971 [Gymnopus androsaceus JB14]|uniref:Uncharacterized protein n=1 Tax=Gymnopus androsaceus JB14 TaxID=1447944 RepID=A0A6A4HU13_9AGAR|nr:hypothetical protein BT96DRAFT_937971 [Gymnopus androsaceus JB14]
MELKAHSKFSRADFKLRLFLPSPFSFAENGSGATLWCCDDEAASSENDNLGPPFPWWKKITRHHNDKSTTIMDIGPILASFQSSSLGTPEEIAELQAASSAIALHNNILGSPPTHPCHLGLYLVRLLNREYSPTTRCCQP